MSWFFGNGVQLDRWVPSAQLSGSNPDAAARSQGLHEVTVELAPLAPSST